MASTYLTKNLSTATDLKTWTWSAWIKRSKLSTEQGLFSGDAASTYTTSFFFDTSDRLQYKDVSAGSTRQQLITNRVFRDTSSWYNIQVVYNSTEGTASNRLKFYVNGSQETSFSTATYPSLNETVQINGSDPTGIGKQPQSTSNNFDGSMAHVHFIDGTAYPASTFGETNAASGIWTPLASPSVTYGNNGFFLKFASSGALGTDSSGNSNTFTVNGSGTQTQDAPSNVFCTMNALDNYYFGGTFSNGNTTVLSTSSGYPYCTSTFGVGKGKYYIEGKYVASSDGNDYSRFGIGYKPATSTTDGLGDETGEAIYRPDGAMKVNGSETSSWGATWATGDIISIALDCDNSKLYFSKNGVFQGGGNPTAGTGGIAITDVTTLSTGNYFFGFGDNSGSGSATWSYNFGNGYFGTTAVASGNADGAGYGIFEYAPPTGYYSLCTKNINTYG